MKSQKDLGSFCCQEKQAAACRGQFSCSRQDEPTSLFPEELGSPSCDVKWTYRLETQEDVQTVTNAAITHSRDENHSMGSLWFWNTEAPGSSRSSREASPAFVFLCTRGRFSIVRQCREKVSGKTLAAKIIPYWQEDKQAVLLEYQVLRKLHHTNIAQLKGAYVSPRHLVLIQEMCVGPELLHSLALR